MTQGYADPAREALVPTPTDDGLPRRYADFATVTEALDYAAQGRKGMNFHDARATLVRVYPFAELREDALASAALNLSAMDLAPEDLLNRILWRAARGTDVPYPEWAITPGADLALIESA